MCENAMSSPDIGLTLLLEAKSDGINLRGSKYKIPQPPGYN